MTADSSIVCIGDWPDSWIPAIVAEMTNAQELQELLRHNQAELEERCSTLLIHHIRLNSRF